MQKRKIYIVISIITILFLFTTAAVCKCQAQKEEITQAETEEAEEEIAKEEVVEETTSGESTSKEQMTDEESTSSDQTYEEETAIEEENEADEETSEEPKESNEQVVYNSDFSLRDIDGNAVYLSNYQGKMVVLNFFATWCGPCIAEIPDFVEVCNQYMDNNVQFIGVSLDSDTSALKQFINDNKMSYPILIDDGNVSNIWNIEFIPTTYVLDENGNILTSRVGQMFKADLVNLIEDNM